jgi:hypothetical protein
MKWRKEMKTEVKGKEREVTRKVKNEREKNNSAFSAPSVDRELTAPAAP